MLPIPTIRYLTTLPLSSKKKHIALGKITTSQSITTRFWRIILMERSLAFAIMNMKSMDSWLPLSTIESTDLISCQINSTRCLIKMRMRMRPTRLKTDKYVKLTWCTRSLATVIIGWLQSQLSFTTCCFTCSRPLLFRWSVIIWELMRVLSQASQSSHVLQLIWSFCPF